MTVDRLRARALNLPSRVLEHLHNILRFAWDFHLAANLAGFIEDAYRSLFDGDVQTDIMFHAALLHLMLVAAPTQTTFIINLKRSTSTFGEGHAGRPNTPSRPMHAIHSETSRAYCLVVMLLPEPRRPVNINSPGFLVAALR